MKNTITAHVMVKNEEFFIFEAIRSVIEHVDKMIIFDTGSTDGTVRKISEAVAWFEDRIVFEEKGECDRGRHTKLRQEMLDRTDTTWFLILDGDEIYHESGIREIRSTIDSAGPEIECLIVPFHLCVGDVYHKSVYGKYTLFGKTWHFSVRLCKVVRGIHWDGDYNQDTLKDGDGRVFFQKNNSQFISQPYWHVSHLPRSPNDAFSSNGDSRKSKQIRTHTIIGESIGSQIPQTLWSPRRLPGYLSLFYFVIFVSTWSIKKCTRLFGKKA